MFGLCIVIGTGIGLNLVAKRRGAKRDPLQSASARTTAFGFRTMIGMMGVHLGVVTASAQSTAFHETRAHAAGLHAWVAEYPDDDVSPAGGGATNPPSAPPPVILSQPADYQGILNGRAAFTVSAFGAEPLCYQWRLNADILPGATNATLVLNPLAAAQMGDYDAVVSNPDGSVTSQVARLVVSTFSLFGDNRHQQSLLPMPMAAPAALALGWNHTVVLFEDGTLTAFGDSSRGQFPTPPGLSNVTAVCAGAYHSLALLSNGTVVAWGFAAFGQLMMPPGLSQVVAVSAGAYHNLALKEDGTVVAWGYNGNHACEVPNGLTHVRAVAAGSYHSLALLADGTVVAWGDNSLGQGIAPPALPRVRAIAAGGYHNLALLADGTVYGWGDNRYGQLDPPAGLDRVCAVAAGDSHSLALRDDGSVRAWGHDHFLQVEVPPAIHHAIAIAAAGDRSLVLGSELDLAVTRLPDPLPSTNTSLPDPLPSTNVIVVIGDSLSTAWPPRYEWTDFMPSVSPKWSNAVVLNFALSGQRTVDAVANYATTVHTKKLAPNEKGWAFIWLGLNDFPYTDESYENLKSLWRMARADGYKVVAFTTTRGGAFTPENGWYQKWVEYNQRILSDPSLYDAICRPDLLFPVPVDPKYFLDGVHATPLGAQMIAAWINSSMEGNW